MTYDMSDQMVSVSGTATGIGSASGQYLYNAENKRVRAIINGRRTFYVYDHLGKLSYSHKENDGEGVTPIRLQSGQTVAKWTGTKLTFLHTDHLGTPIRGTHGQGTGHAAGDVVFNEFYTPFGLNPTSGWHGNTTSGFNPTHGPGSNAGVTGFTDHAKDVETGLTYMQARHFDPVAGRFLSIDPVTFMDTGNPVHFNRYTYANNDPVNMIDPDGQVAGAAVKLVRRTIKHKGDVGKAVFEVGGDVVTVFAPSSTPLERLESVVALVSPIDFDDAKAAKRGLKALGKKGGGRKGSLDTRAQNIATGDSIEKKGGASDGWFRRKGNTIWQRQRFEVFGW